MSEELGFLVVKEIPSITFYAPFIFSIISMICSILVLVSYHSFKDIKLGTARYMKILIYFELFMTFLFFFSNFYAPHYIEWPIDYFLVEEKGYFCRFLGYIYMYAYLMYLTMNYFFCNYIFRILGNPNERTNVMNEIIFSFGHGFFWISMIYWLGDYGYSHRFGMCNCLYENSILLNIYLSVFLPILTLSSFIRTFLKLNSLRMNQNEAEIDLKSKKTFFFINLSYLFVFFILVLFASFTSLSSWLFGSKNTITAVFCVIYLYVSSSNSFFLSIVRLKDPIVKSYLLHFLTDESTFTNDFSYCESEDDNNYVRIDYTNKARITSDDSFIKTFIETDDKERKMERKYSDGLLGSRFLDFPVDTLRDQPEFLFYQKYISRLIIKAESKNFESLKESRNEWRISDFIKFEKYDFTTKEGEFISLLSYSSKFFFYSKFYHKVSIGDIINSFESSSDLLKSPNKSIILTSDHKFKLQVIKKHTKLALINTYLPNYRKHLTERPKNVKCYLPKLLGLYTITLTREKCINILLSLNDELEEPSETLECQLLKLKRGQEITINLKRGESVGGHKLYEILHTIPRMQRRKYKNALIRDMHFLIKQGIFNYSLDMISILEHGYCKQEYLENSINPENHDLEKGFQNYMKKTSPLKIYVILSQLFEFYGLSPSEALQDEEKSLPEEYYLNECLEMLKKYLD